MKPLSLSFILVLLVVSAEAQTLDECRRLAREHYPEIGQYDLISRTEQFNLSNAAKAWIPQVACRDKQHISRQLLPIPKRLKP